MQAEMSTELEHLLLDFAVAERGVVEASERLNRRHHEIAQSIVDRVARLPAAERPTRQAAAEELIALRRGKFRSELAHLAADIVSEERRRAQILRKLDAYPQFGESAPVIDIAIEHDGERGFTIKTGGGKASQFKLPALIDRGVWRGDGSYERGDCVTADGSLWIAREDNPNHEPGKGPQWRLAVTKGKNGRDAKNLRSST